MKNRSHLFIRECDDRALLRGTCRRDEQTGLSERYVAEHVVGVLNELLSVTANFEQPALMSFLLTSASTAAAKFD